MPAISATPSAIAMPVSSTRSLRCRKPRRTSCAIRCLCVHGQSAREQARALRRRDPSVHQPIAFIRSSASLGRDRRGRRARSARRPARSRRSAKDAAWASWVTITTVWSKSSTAWRSSSSTSLGGFRVEVAGGLVGEHDGRARDERARDRDALLLAAGELRGAVVEAVADADGVDQPVEPLAVGLAPGDRQRQQDVLFGVQHRQQVERLEDEADPVAAQLGQALVVEPGQLDAVEAHRARRSGGRGRRAMCISVDLPEPDGPMIAAKRRGREARRSRRTRASTAASPSP